MSKKKNNSNLLLLGGGAVAGLLLLKNSSIFTSSENINNIAVKWKNYEGGKNKYFPGTNIPKTTFDSAYLLAEIIMGNLMDTANERSALNATKDQIVWENAKKRWRAIGPNIFKGWLLIGSPKWSFMDYNQAKLFWDETILVVDAANDTFKPKPVAEVRWEKVESIAKRFKDIGSGLIGLAEYAPYAIIGITGLLVYKTFFK